MSNTGDLAEFLRGKPEQKEDVLKDRQQIEALVEPMRYSTLRRLISDPQHRTVVSFGGGSLAGLCGNLALAKILEELDLRQHVEEIWGTSAGAIVGGGWSTGTDATPILDRVRSLDRKDAIDVHRVRLALSVLATMWPFRRDPPDGLIEGRHFWETIDSGLAVKNFEETKTPFRCIACNADGLTRKVFRRGPLLPAIFASMSVPGVVVPRPIPGDDKLYYDGGLIEKTPLFSPISEHLTRGDGRKLLLICTHFGNEAFLGEAKGFHHRFLATMYALENLAWDYQLKEARTREDIVLILVNPQLGERSMFDFSRTDLVYLTARSRLKDLLQNARIAGTFGMT
jgi:predicted acylesterase/phospholipase RssA